MFVLSLSLLLFVMFSKCCFPFVFVFVSVCVFYVIVLVFLRCSFGRHRFSVLLLCCFYLLSMFSLCSFVLFDCMCVHAFCVLLWLSVFIVMFLCFYVLFLVSPSTTPNVVHRALHKTVPKYSGSTPQGYILYCIILYDIIKYYILYSILNYTIQYYVFI